MRIPVPFGYEASVLTSGGNRADRRYRETILVDIGEFAPGELPAVLTWRGHHPRADQAPVTALAHDGGLFEPISYKSWENGEQVDRPVEAGAVAPAVEEATDEWGHAAQPDVRAVFKQRFATRPFDQSDPYRHKGPPKPATVLDSGRDDALAQALGAARDFIAVGGNLYRRVAEPLLLAHAKGVWIVDEAGEHPRRDLFRLDESELARERACLLGNLAPAGAAMPDYTLHRPEMLTREMDPSALGDTVAALLRESASRLHVLPVAVMEAHYDLQEAAHPAQTDYSKPRPDPDPTEVVALARALCEALSALPDRPGGLAACLHGLERAEASLPSPRPGAMP